MKFKTILKILKDNREPYDDLLNSPEWNKKRAKILQRDKFCCSNCGKTTTTLHVHHKYYLWETEPWDYNDDALITLCTECHDNIHKSHTIPWKIYINGVLKDFNFTCCTRCGGKGYIDMYKHVEGGKCFRCRGVQYEEIIEQHKAFETKKSAFVSFEDLL